MTWQLDPYRLRHFHRALAVISSPLESPSLDAWRRDVLASLAEVFDASGGAFALPQDDAPLSTLLDRPEAYLEAYLSHENLDITSKVWVARGKPAACSTTSLCEGRRSLYTDSEIYSTVYEPYAVIDALILPIEFDDRRFVARDERWTAGGVTFSGMLALYSDRVGRPAFNEGLSVFALVPPALTAASHMIQRLGDARRELATLIDQSSGGVALFGRDGALSHRNPALVAMLAIDPDAHVLGAAMAAVARRFAAGRDARSYSAILEGHQKLEHRVATTARRYVLRATSIDAIIGHGASVAVTVEAESPAPWDDVALAQRFGLTTREIEVARLIASGAANDSVAATLGISPHTAKRHTEQVLKKLQLTSRTEVAALLFGPR